MRPRKRDPKTRTTTHPTDGRLTEGELTTNERLTINGRLNRLGRLFFFLFFFLSSSFSVVLFLDFGQQKPWVAGIHSAFTSCTTFAFSFFSFLISGGYIYFSFAVAKLISAAFGAHLDEALIGISYDAGGWLCSLHTYICYYMVGVGPRAGSIAIQ